MSCEEKYKNLVEAIKKFRDLNFHDEGIRNWVNDNVPELAESDDERVRKALLEMFSNAGRNDWRGIPNEKVIAWLEKQGEQKPVEEYNGEDFGIDSLYHAQRILEKTLGKVDGYQSDDGILEHKCAISSVKKLYRQKSDWSEEDERILEGIIDEIEANKNEAPSYDLPIYDKYLNWLESLRNKIKNE